MRKPDADDIFHEAILRWGVAAQMDMALEEMGELIVAIQQRRRNRTTDTEIAEEVADVSIMMLQLRKILGEQLVDDLITQKIDRLQSRLEKAGASFGAVE